MLGIIFDFNGTMVFDSHYHDEAWRAFSTKLRGVMISDEEIEQHVHGNVNEKIIEYLLPHVSKEENAMLSAKKEELYRELSRLDENYQLVAGLPAYLDEVKQKQIATTIASASIKDNIDYFVSTFMLGKWFDPNKIIYDDGSYSDKRQMFLDAAKAIGVPIEQCIIFEDSVSGIACAKQVNPKAIVVVADEAKKEVWESDEQISLVVSDFNDERLVALLK